jgi:hypothetical protein
VIGWAGAAAQLPPEQSPSVLQVTAMSFVQRRQSALVVQGDALSAQNNGSSPGPRIGERSAAVRVTVPVVMVRSGSDRPAPETFAPGSGGQSLETPPNTGLTASTVHDPPCFGPPAHVNV